MFDEHYQRGSTVTAPSPYDKMQYPAEQRDNERRQTMTNTVQVGIIGTSWWADVMHLPSLKSHPRAELYSICGRNRTRAEELASKYAIPHVFTDYHDLIKHGNLQALVIATPDDLHYPITMAALDAGLHVLCEKPLALTAVQAQAMYDKAEAAGVKHMVLFTYRWIPIYRYVRQLIDQGYLGRCYHCNIRYLGGYGRDGQYGWRFDAQHSNGILGDLGSHMIDLARWFVGDIAKVSGQLTTFVDRPDPNGERLDAANDAAMVAVQFANGAQGTIHVSAVAHIGERGQEQQVILHGEEGTLEVACTFTGAELRGIHHDEKQIHPLAIPNELWGEVDRTKPYLDQLFELFYKQSAGPRLFIDTIGGDGIAEPTFYEGLQVQAVLDAAIESHRSGQWVTLK
jgi:predicted dehydrogenase